MLQTNLDSLPNSGRNVRLDITLRVPKETSAEVTTEHGDLILDGLKGDQTLSVRGGDAHSRRWKGWCASTKGAG